MEPYYYYHNDQITVIIMITLCRPSCVCVSVSSSRTHTRFLLQEKGSDAHFKEERKETAADGRQPADGFWGTEKKKKKTLRDLHKPPSWKEKRRIGTLEDKNKRKPILLQRSRALNPATLKENVLKLRARPLNLQTDDFTLTELCDVGFIHFLQPLIFRYERFNYIKVVKDEDI